MTIPGAAWLKPLSSQSLAMGSNSGYTATKILNPGTSQEELLSTSMLLWVIGRVKRLKTNDTVLVRPSVINPAVLKPKGIRDENIGPPKRAPKLKMR